MNKWRKRAREWRKQLGEMEKHSWNWYESYLEAAKQRDAAREREAAALNKEEELRRELVKSATELARVQGVCAGLLAWQRGVREAWAAYDAEDEVEASTLDRLRQAIEVEAGMKEDA
jgi:hypothetical protein